MKGITFFLLLYSFSVLHSQPVSLRDTTNQYDYIIITVPEFVSACEPFRHHKETVRNFRTLIADTTQIFAEFYSGSTPQDNIRDFISFAGTFWKEPKPEFFLIVGTVQMVPNFPITNSIPPPTYFYSDYDYSQNIYENDPATTDFLVGRIPCKDETEIYNYFSKVMDYEIDSTIYSWMNNALFLCLGDDNLTLDNAFVIASSFPSYIRPFYITENDTSQYYGTLDSIYSAVNQRGNEVVWLVGLDTNWFNIEDINGFTNEDKYFVTFCSVKQSAILDTNINMTQAMMMLDDAGSIGGVVFVGIPYYGLSMTFQMKWAQRIFNPGIQSIGEAFVLDSLPYPGIYSYMKKISNLWADPSLKLKYDVTVGILNEPNVEAPDKFLLYQNYPNPFNPATTIKFALPIEGRVKINVYSILGQLVETLVDKEMKSGNHEVKFNAKHLPSGIYLYRIESSSFTSVKKMVLLK